MKIVSKCLALFISTSLFISACDSDDDDLKHINCFPESLFLGGDSIVFLYNSNKKLSELAYYSSKVHLGRKDKLSYNTEGKVIGFDRFWMDGTLERLSEKYTVEYENGLVKRVLKTTDLTNIPLVTEFIHDSNSKLIEAKTIRDNLLFFGYRYEYNVDGNVTKVFYSNPVEKDVLARENLSFDTKARFYSGSKDLELSNIYIYGYVPSKNNVVSSRVTRPDPNTWFIKPLDVAYDIRYDQNGFVSDIIVPLSYLFENNLRRIKYNCP